MEWTSSCRWTVLIPSALEIFNPTAHPSIYKANTTNNVREVNSLFGTNDSRQIPIAIVCLDQRFSNDAYRQLAAAS